MTTKLRTLVAAAIAVAMTFGSVAAAEANEVAPAAPVTSNVASRWLQRALDAVRSGNPALHTSTPGAARTYAMTTAAMYDAVNAIDVANGTSARGGALVLSYSGASAGADREAAASAAAHAVLRSLFASNSGVASSLDAAVAQEVAARGSGPEVETGRAWGASIGDQVLAIRANDGTQQAVSAPGGTGPGAFPRTFSGTQFRHMTPFGIQDIAPYRSSGPPELTSTEYAEAFNEVKTLGSSTDTDSERAAIARHWLAENLTVRETGLWLKAALNIASAQGTLASLPDTVRLFARLGMAIADAVVVSWNDKFDWSFWRPGDAIRQASTDGNPATEADPTWSPRNGICTSTDVVSCAVFGGTPEHTSGTSTFAGASAAVLADFYCTDRIPFSFTGEQTGSPTRTYGSFAEAAREAGRSRIYGGIHFQFSNEDGREAGTDIGKEVARTRLTTERHGTSGNATCGNQTAAQ